mgnify:CR=1 FL=1
MKKRKVAVIYMSEDKDYQNMQIVFRENYSLIEKLGMLEWAKAAIYADSERDVALSEYHEAEI